MLLTNRAAPQISDSRPDMRQRELFVTIRAAWRWNRMLLTRENVDSPVAAIVLATEYNARCAPGCQPPSADMGKGSGVSPVLAAWSMPAYLVTLTVHAAFNRFIGFPDTSRIQAWLRGWQVVTSKTVQDDQKAKSHYQGVVLERWLLTRFFCVLEGINKCAIEFPGLYDFVLCCSYRVHLKEISAGLFFTFVEDRLLRATLV